jgi:hypothetical protein
MQHGTALTTAASHGTEAVVTQLLVAGANVTRVILIPFPFLFQLIAGRQLRPEVVICAPPVTSDVLR